MPAWRTGCLLQAITSVYFIGAWHLSSWTRHHRWHSLIHAALFSGAPRMESITVVDSVNHGLPSLPDRIAGPFRSTRSLRNNGNSKHSTPTGQNWCGLLYFAGHHIGGEGRRRRYSRPSGSL